MRILAILATLLSFFLLSRAYEIQSCGSEKMKYMPDSCATCEPMTWYSTGPMFWNWDHIVRGCFQRETYGYRCVYVGADYEIPKQWYTFRQNVNTGSDEVKAPKVRECFYDKYGRKLNNVYIGQGVTRDSDSACSNNALKNDHCVKDAKRLDEERHLEQWYYRPAGGVYETPACKRCPQQKDSKTVDVSIANNTLTCVYDTGGPNGKATRCQYDAVTGVRTYSSGHDVPAFSGFKKEPDCDFTMADRGTLACEERLIKEDEEKAAKAAAEAAAKAKEAAAAKFRQAQVKRCSGCIAKLLTRLVVSDGSPLPPRTTLCHRKDMILLSCPALFAQGALTSRVDRCQVCKDLSLTSSIGGKSKSKVTLLYRLLCQLDGKQLGDMWLQYVQDFLSGPTQLMDLLLGLFPDEQSLVASLSGMMDPREIVHLLWSDDAPPNKPECTYLASTFKTVKSEGCSKCTIADPPSSFRVPVTNESFWYQDSKGHPRYWLFTCPKDAKKVLECPVDQQPEDGSKKGGPLGGI